MPAVILSKTPDESEPFNFDFTARSQIVAGQTITGAVITYTGADAMLTISAPAISGGVVQARIADGTSGVTYCLECEITTSGGDTLTCCGQLLVLGCCDNG